MDLLLKPDLLDRSSLSHQYQKQAPINAAAVFSWKTQLHGALPLTFRDISC